MKRNGVIALPFIAIALYVIHATWSMSIWSDGPEEGLLPFVLACALLVLSGAFLLQGRTANAVQPAVTEEDLERGNTIYYYLSVLFFYALTLQPLGFVLSTALSLTILLKWVEGESWGTTALVAIGFNLLAYLLFSTALGIPLPRGLLPLLLGAS